MSEKSGVGINREEGTGQGRKVVETETGSGFTNLDDFLAEVEEAIRREEREIYTEKTLEEAYNPKNVGKLSNPDGAARITGPCGDTLQIHLKVEGGRITDSKFISDGCGPSVACGSVITEMVRGKTIEEAFKIESGDIIAILGGLPEESVHCSVLAVDTLRAALEDYRSKKKENGRI